MRHREEMRKEEKELFGKVDGMQGYMSMGNVDSHICQWECRCKFSYMSMGKKMQH